MQELKFTIAWRQLRELLIYTLVLLAITIGLSVPWATSGNPGSTGPWAVGLGIGAVIAGYSTAAYGLAFTECTAAGLRTRGLAGVRICAWTDVVDITLRPGTRGTRTVLVTTSGGQRFILGAPVSSPVMRDPLFLNKYDQIIGYWGHAVDGVSRPMGSVPRVRPGTRKVGGVGAVGAVGARPYLLFLMWIGRLAFVGIAVLGAILLYFGLRDVGPAWAAHLGHGVPGVFTATNARYWQDCTQTCHTGTEWIGTFTSRYGTRVGVPLSHDGAYITAIGQHQAVLYESNGWAYGNGGGPDWLLTTLMVVGGAALLGYSAIRALRALARSRRSRSSRS